MNPLLPFACRIKVIAVFVAIMLSGAVQAATLIIDPADFSGQYYVNNVSYTGINTFEFATGGHNIGIGGYDNARIDVDSNGDVTTSDPDSIAISGSTITFMTQPVTIDPGAYSGLYNLERVNNSQWVSGLTSVNLVVSQRFVISPGAYGRIFFQVNAAGNVISEQPDSAYGGTNSLNFITSPVIVDPGLYAGQYSFDRAASPAWWTGTNSFDLVTAQRYRMAPGDYGSIIIDVDAFGNVTTLQLDSVYISGNVVNFNTVSLNVDPGSYAGSYNFLRASTALSGSQAVELVPNQNYRLEAGGNYSGILSLSYPCAIDPPEVSLSSGSINISLSCGYPDQDEDGVPDISDNCPMVSNPDQVDQDIDGIGNACDLDLDGDGIANLGDNCPDLSNSLQMDLDNDGIGDACDTDSDNDSVPDTEDNCPLVANTDQANSDFDVQGDACDLDDDNDSVLDAFDNCPVTANPSQSDFDGDGEGDACDGDTDSDGVLNDSDQCPASPADLPINVDGCSGQQLIAHMCNIGLFVQHGQYVSCVAHAANDAQDQGLISNKEKALFIKEAAKGK